MRRFLVWLFLAGGAAGLPGGSVADGQQPAEPTRRALLVGVTKYPNLAERLQLDGPANDVKLMRAVLAGPFKFAAADIVTLSEADGAAKGELLPTRANIEREFKRLAEVAKAGEEVVVLLGGHGSQSPEKADGMNPEIDGLDEIFLPRDAGRWDDKAGAVRNAILDDELGEWVAAIQRKGAFVWLVVDACHSGTMTRGPDDAETARKVEPEPDLLVPPRLMKAAADRAAKRHAPAARGEADKPTAIGFGGKKGVFALYACQPSETTTERPMPPGGARDAVRHGVLTYTICQALTQAKAAASPITYRELAQRVHQQYAAWGRTSPTPMAEYASDTPDREVLGPGVWKDRSTILLSASDAGSGRGGFRINAGRLLGLTPGSILEVTPPAGTGDKVLGHVKVVRTTALGAEVEPTGHAGLKAVQELPADARCRVVHLDYGEVKLTVSVATHYPDAARKAVPDGVRKPLLERLKAAAKPESLFRFVESPGEAAWLVSPVPGGRVVLLPAAGVAPKRLPPKSKGDGSVPGDAGMEAWLEKSLERIARAEGLVAMAADRSKDILSADDAAPRFEVKVTLMDADDRTPVKTLPWPASDLAVFDKDRLRIEVANTGRIPFDLTVLYVDADHAIHPGFPPRAGESNRLKRGESVSIRSGIDASETVGIEHLVVLAVAADGPETNLLCLAQKEPGELRGVAASARERAGEGPLTRTASRLERLVYKSGKADASRGTTTDSAGDLTMRLVTWQVKNTTRPAEPKK